MVKVTKATIRQVRGTNYTYWIARVPGGSPDIHFQWKKNRAFPDWDSALNWVINHPKLGWNPCAISMAKSHPPGEECQCEVVI